MSNSNSNKDDDILKFVLKKCQEPDIDSKNKVIYLFLKYYVNALCKTYNTTKNIKYSIECADLTTHIFNIIYNYTHHIRVSIFMMERTTFLFNQCINVSQFAEMDIPFIKTSIIHKTIGSININSKLHTKVDDISRDINTVHTIGRFLKNIFIKLVGIIYNNQNELQNSLCNSITSQDLMQSIDNITNDTDNIANDQDPLSYHLEYTMLLLHSILYRIIIEGFENLVELLLDEFINSDITDIIDYPRSVNIIRLRLELFLHAERYFNDNIKAKHISLNIMEEYSETLDNDDNLNEYMDYTQPIRNHYHFKMLKDKLIFSNK
jgi:hypothetical protein